MSEPSLSGRGMLPHGRSRGDGYDRTMDLRSGPRPARATLGLARRAAAALLVIGIAASSPLPALSAEPRAGQEHPAKGEAALLGRLVAPCCWTQTLDVHAGPMADSLRAEVRTRLAAGEAPSSIEDDLVARYGPRIRSSASERPLVWAGLGVGALSLLSIGMLLFTIRRWVRRSARAAAAFPAPSAERDADDERLDEELRLLDG